MSYEQPKNTIDQTQAHKLKKKSNKIRRETVLSANSEVAPTTSYRVLSISKQSDKYLLNYSDLVLRDSYKSLSEDQLYTLQFLQFSEAVKALWHNIKFVLSSQNFGAVDKNGTSIDMDFFKNLTFKSNSNIRSCFAHKTVIKAVLSPDAIESCMIQTLEKSQELVAYYEDAIMKIKQQKPELYEKLSSTLDTKVKLMSISIDLITALKNNRINLDEFKDQIYYGRRPSPSFNF